MAETVIEVEKLSVTLPTPNGQLNAVHEVSFRLSRGESIGIVGESGSGKSMTALAVMNLLPRNGKRRAKKLHMLNNDLLSMPAAAFSRNLAGQRVGMIFQEPMTALNPVYTIGRQLTESVVSAGLMSELTARKNAIDLLDRVGLADPAARFDQYPHQFSGGQRQRVMIAMALMTEPDLIIADEPTTALDVTIQAQILKLLADIQREFGMAMILITHDLGVVAQTVDKMAVMYAGEFIETGPVADVLNWPRHPYTAALLRAAPELGRSRTRLSAIPGQILPIYKKRTKCVFANRCTLAEPNCYAARPSIRAANGDHHYRCILKPDRVDSMTVELKPLVRSEPGSDANIIELYNIFRVFNSRRTPFHKPTVISAVNGVSLNVRRGETFALVGESGSGKTTLARILLGLDQATSGQVAIDKQPLTALSGAERARLIQPIFQDPYSSLNPRRSIGEIIEQPLSLHVDCSRENRRATVLQIMDLVGLPKAFLHNYPNQLSGGQRQRVAIARALILQPKILVCDEPTSALDVSVQAQILNLLCDLREEVGLTLFLITHDIGVVHQIADRIAVMKEGQIVETGMAEQVLRRPKASYTKNLLSAVPSTKLAFS